MTSPASGRAGFALTEALVALLLLATALLGMASSLVQAMAVTRAATLQSRAVDLVSDLSERLRVPYAVDAQNPEAVRMDHVRDWQQEVARILPLAPEPDPARLTLVIPTGESTALRSSHEITLAWREPVSRHTQQLILPLALGDH